MHSSTPLRTVWREIKELGTEVKGCTVFCLPLILGRPGVQLAYVTIWACAAAADKAKIVCTGAKLRGARCVDSVLIRALTAEVRRSGVALSFDWTPGNLMEPSGRVAARGCSAQNFIAIISQSVHKQELSLINLTVKPSDSP